MGRGGVMSWAWPECWGVGLDVSPAAGDPLRKEGGDHFTDVCRFFDTRPEHVEPQPNPTRVSHV